MKKKKVNLQRKNEEKEREELKFTSTNEDISFEDDLEFLEESSCIESLKKVKSELKEEKKKAKEYLTGWQKERAEFANYRMREGERIEREKKNSLVNFLQHLLSVLDSFDMAFSHKDAWEQIDPSWRKGIEHIYAQLLDVLSQFSVQRIDKTLIPFDPQFHDPVEMVPTNEKKKDQHIAEVVRSGYRIQDDVIRPARVKVFEFQEEKSEKNQES